MRNIVLAIGAMIAIPLLGMPQEASSQYDPAVEQWRPAVSEACAVYGCSTDYVLGVIGCESGGDPGAWHANPYGGADIGVAQINDATWGSVAYADPVTQIWWMAANLGSVWWMCG